MNYISILILFTLTQQMFLSRSFIVLRTKLFLLTFEDKERVEL